MKYNALWCTGLTMVLMMFLCSCGDNNANSGEKNTSGEINALQKQNETQNPSPEEIFKELKTLVEYSRAPADTKPYVAEYLYNFATKNYLIRETLKFNECTLVSEKIWRAETSTRPVDLTTPTGKQSIISSAWKMNLDEVDAQKTDALRSSKIVLVRGAVFDHLQTYDKNGGWYKSEDLELIPVFNRNFWNPNTKYARQTVESSQQRSGDFELGVAYPEDQKEIHEAFDKLVRACQRPDVIEQIARHQPIIDAEEARIMAEVTANIVSEGLNLAGAAKLAVTETFAEQGKFPSVGNNSDANVAYGLPFEYQIVSKYVKGIAALNSGVLRITYNDNLGGEPSANGRTILLKPTMRNNQIIDWDCSGGSMPAEYRPQSCRKAEEATGNSMDTTPATHQRNIPNVASTESIEHKVLTLPRDELMAKGEQVYNKICAACHQAGGVGIPGVFPAIAGSKIAIGDKAAHINIVVHGKLGTAMQAFNEQLSEVDLASVITYERNAFGNKAGDMVQPADVVTAK